MITQDWTLITLALASVVLLVVLVTRFKVNAFLALALASLLVGGGAVLMGVKEVDAKAPIKIGEQVRVLDILEFFTTGMGVTLGGIAAIIGLGTMLGRFLAESGGAEVIARRFTEIFGPKRVGLCIMALAIVVGLPTWMAVGLVLLQPVLISLTHETKEPFLKLAIPLISCMSVMHGLMPPHPGPVAAMGAFQKEGFDPNMGMILIWDSSSACPPHSSPARFSRAAPCASFPRKRRRCPRLRIARTSRRRPSASRSFPSCCRSCSCCWTRSRNFSCQRITRSASPQNSSATAPLRCSPPCSSQRGRSARVAATRAERC